MHECFLEDHLVILFFSGNKDLRLRAITNNKPVKRRKMDDEVKPVEDPPPTASKGLCLKSMKSLKSNINE